MGDTWRFEKLYVFISMGKAFRFINYDYQPMNIAKSFTVYRKRENIIPEILLPTGQYEHYINVALS